MNEKNFVRICYTAMLVIFLVWLVILTCMGQFANVPKMIGCFVVGWYLRNIVDAINNVRKEDFSSEDKSAKTNRQQI